MSYLVNEALLRLVKPAIALYAERLAGHRADLRRHVWPRPSPSWLK